MKYHIIPSCKKKAGPERSNGSGILYPAFYTFCTLALFFLIIPCHAQDELPIGFKLQKESSLSLGYTLNFEDADSKKFHLMEVRFQKQKYGGRHPVFTTLSSGLDIGLNTSDLLVGPRVGGIAGFGGFFLGTDLAYYTDLDKGTLRLIPAFGIGFYQIRLSINPHIRLTNRDFEPINRFQANLTVRLWRFKKEGF